MKRIGCGGLGGGAPAVVVVVAYLSRGEYRLDISEGGIVLPAHGILYKMCPHLHSQTARITITTITATTIRTPTIAPAIGPALPPVVEGGPGVPPSMYKEEHAMSCLQLHCVSHMHYSLVALVVGVSVWEVGWEVIESEPWNEKINE